MSIANFRNITLVGLLVSLIVCYLAFTVDTVERVYDAYGLTVAIATGGLLSSIAFVAALAFAIALGD